MVYIKGGILGDGIILKGVFRKDMDPFTFCVR